MRGLRLLVAISAVIFVLIGTLGAVFAIFLLVDTRWIGAAALGAFAVAFYILAFWLYLAWRKLGHAAEREHQRASAK